MDSKKQRIKECCYICLRDGQDANDCLKRDSRCYYCKQLFHHHRSLCPQKFRTSHRESAKLGDEVPTEDGIEYTESSLISSGEMILMQTARAGTKSTTLGCRHSTRLLLDSDSQRTYITESLAKKMNLKMGKMDEIMIETFWLRKAQTDKITTKLDIILKDGST